MDVVRLNALSRQLREIAVATSRGNGDVGISVAQLAVVEAVARSPGITIVTITRTTGLAQSWVSTIVRELTDAGVFVLGKDPDDRRRTRVSLSAEATRLTFDERGSRDVSAGLADTAPHLDETGKQRVVELLTELEALLQPDSRPISQQGAD